MKASLSLKDSLKAECDRRGIPYCISSYYIIAIEDINLYFHKSVFETNT